MKRLPDCLEEVDGGIRIKGHRISLYLIVDAVYLGKSINDLLVMYDSVSRDELEEVINFCKSNKEFIRKYHNEVKKKLEDFRNSKINKRRI